MKEITYKNIPAPEPKKPPQTERYGSSLSYEAYFRICREDARKALQKRPKVLKAFFRNRSYQIKIPDKFVWYDLENKIACTKTSCVGPVIDKNSGGCPAVGKSFHVLEITRLSPEEVAAIGRGATCCYYANGCAYASTCRAERPPNILIKTWKLRESEPW